MSANQTSSNQSFYYFWKTNETTVDDFDSVNDTMKSNTSPWMIMTILPPVLAVESLGNVGLFALIIHEKYGSDPMKRNVTNQLLSSLLMAAIFANLAGLPGLAFRLLVAPLQTTLAVWTGYATGFAYYYVNLSGAQIVVLKCLFISHWSRMAAMADDFLARFIKLFNVIWLGMIFGMFLISGQYITIPVIKYLSGDTGPHEFRFHKELTVIFYGIPNGICFATCLFGGVFIVHKKYKYNKICRPKFSCLPTSVSPEPQSFELQTIEEQPQEQVHEFNNSKFNKSILSASMAVLQGIVITAGCSVLPIFLRYGHDENIMDLAFVFIVLLQSTIFTLFPLMYFYRNPNHMNAMKDFCL